MRPHAFCGDLRRRSRHFAPAKLPPGFWSPGDHRGIEPCKAVARMDVYAALAGFGCCEFVALRKYMEGDLSWAAHITMGGTSRRAVAAAAVYDTGGKRKAMAVDDGASVQKAQEIRHPGPRVARRPQVGQREPGPPSPRRHGYRWRGGALRP